jgi:hypothetical protein
VTVSAALWCGYRETIFQRVHPSGSPDKRTSRERQDEMDALRDALPSTLELNSTSRATGAIIRKLRS